MRKCSVKEKGKKESFFLRDCVGKQKGNGINRIVEIEKALDLCRSLFAPCRYLCAGANFAFPSTRISYRTWRVRCRAIQRATLIFYFIIIF